MERGTTHRRRRGPHLDLGLDARDDLLLAERKRLLDLVAVNVVTISHGQVNEGDKTYLVRVNRPIAMPTARSWSPGVPNLMIEGDWSPLAPYVLLLYDSKT